MPDLLTFLIVAAVVIGIAAIVVASLVVGRRRRRLTDGVDAPDDPRQRDGDSDREVREGALGDRSDILRRARRGF